MLAITVDKSTTELEIVFDGRSRRQHLLKEKLANGKGDNKTDRARAIAWNARVNGLLSEITRLHSECHTQHLPPAHLPRPCWPRPVVPPGMLCWPTSPLLRHTARASLTQLTSSSVHLALTENGGSLYSITSARTKAHCCEHDIWLRCAGSAASE
jgi:hypothetical protein